ncbi:MAG: NADPH:quinone reductase [Actinobacteria bacterium]|nr:NADPH:quinone reductase [Actinomycetota bacterium]
MGSVSAAAEGSGQPPATMRAAYILRTGGIDQIRIGPLPVPRPGPTDVLVRVVASAVNHVDLFVRSGAYATHTPFPFVIGRDLVGTVVETGPGVDGFASGDRVWCNSLGHHGRQGAYSEYAAVAADRLYRLPDGVDPLAAAPVLHTAATAYLGLVREAGLSVGETILVGGAGGGVGSAVVQLAEGLGARVIATASPEDVEWCRSCGADVVLDYRSAHLDEELRAAAPDGIDVWWDTSGHHDFGAALSHLTLGGRIVVMAAMGANPSLPVGALYTRDASLRGFAISNASVEDLADAARTINALLATGRLRSRIAATYRLDEAADAQRRLESPGVRGRILVLSS